MTIRSVISQAKALRRDRDNRRKKRAASLPSTRTDESLLDLIPRITPRWERPDHLAPLVRLFERAEHEPIRAVVSVPPRHGKTETILHAIAWWLGRHPEQTVAYASYAAQIATSKSRLARDYALRSGVVLRQDAAALQEWRTTQNGGCLAAGVGGPLTGHGANLLIVDDPHKNRAEAESFTIRERIHQWFTSTAMSRLEPGGSAIVVHTRWHPDDLIGRLEQDDEVDWEVLNLPAIAEERTPERDIGEALWASRWPVEALLARQRDVGPYDWASLYGGRPRPRGGSVFGDVHRFSRLPSGYRVAIGVDLAYSEKTASDYSVAVVLAEKDGVYYVLDVLRLQVSAPQFADRLKALQESYPGAKTRAYVAGTEKGSADFFTKGGSDLGARSVHGDKFVRAQPVAAKWNDAKVLVPEQAPWLRDFLGEVALFTGVKDRHDDQIDALAAAFDALPSRIAGRSPGVQTHDLDHVG